MSVRSFLFFPEEQYPFRAFQQTVAPSRGQGKQNTVNVGKLALVLLSVRTEEKCGKGLLRKAKVISAEFKQH